MEQLCQDSPIYAALTAMQAKKQENLYFIRKEIGYALTVAVTTSPAELSATDVQRREPWRIQLRSDHD